MDIKRIIVGFLQTNCYILSKSNECLIVDPGSDYNDIIESTKNLNIIGILITHRHPDHIGALNQFDLNNIKIYDKSAGEGLHKLGDFSFNIINNSGHTSDSISFYFKEENVLFCGDFIFKETIGRTDLPTGNESEMKESLKMISKYPNDMVIFPGHGENTTLGNELNNNPYFKNI